MADMMYMIKDQILVGTVNGIHFQMNAVSGGRAGSKVPRAVNADVANNPYRTDQKLNKRKRIVGGPLPCGLYQMEAETKKKFARIKLIPASSNLMTGREPYTFAIHGRGQRGSDGCIVPLVYPELVNLRNAVQQNGGGTLEVVGGHDIATRTT